jgi:hypothetical protein
MKNLIFVLALFNFGIMYSQSNSEVAGWRGTKWGMSVEDVKNIFGSELSEIDNPEAFPDDYYPFMIRDYEIADQTYDVKFIFKKDSHTLYQIKIVKMLESGYNWKNIIIELEAALGEKYGTPSFKNDNPYNCTWSLPSIKIELEYLKGTICYIYLCYSQPNNDIKSKI